ncbi:MAG: PD-(D/E)XK nuclease family protein [Pseudomonadota bacterium]
MNIQASTLPFIFVEHSKNPLDALTLDVFNLKNSSNNLIILCESRADIHNIRLQLIRQAQTKNIKSFQLPDINSMQDWVWQQARSSKPILSEYHKQLLLVDAIRQSKSIFKTNNLWAVSKELISLFNECTLAQIPLELGESSFRELLNSSYGLSKQDLHSISKESEIIYKLWLAYQDQIKAGNLIDPIDLYCHWLANQKEFFSDSHFYLIGKHRIYPAEAIFLNRIKDSLSIYYPQVDPDNLATANHPHLKFFRTYGNHAVKPLDIIFNSSSDTFKRINQLKSEFPNNPFPKHLSLFTAGSIENHVWAICLQTKKWLLEDKTPIAIIANDRLLIRRIRAVLEEEGIRANDLGGWAFSTTSAATSIEALLDATEKDFKKEPLLDLISSPFLPQSGILKFKQQVYACRNILHKHRSLPSDNIDKFIELISKELMVSHELTTTLSLLKDSFESFFKPLRIGEHKLSKFCNSLMSVLNALGIKDCLINDLAGAQLLDTLESLIHSTNKSDIQINWNEWRQWLRGIFENNYFIPGDTDNRVTLCGFQYIDNTKYDYVIFAGIEEKRIISAKKQGTFFNEKVRYELKLKTNQETNAINYIRFRQVIEQSKHVLLTAESISNGESQEISSWVKMIELFSQSAYSQSLKDDELLQIFSSYKNFKALKKHQVQTQPKAYSACKLVPENISATQYQSLIDCPYQYFAKYILGLKDQEQSEKFEAADFGKLVHQSLYTFHFQEHNKESIKFTIDNRDQLIKQLTNVSTSIFNHALFSKSAKQGWFQRWALNIPAYIDWSIERSNEWKPLFGEKKINQQFIDSTNIEGQIDRIDSNQQHHSVVDFKTGSFPSDKSIRHGEAVQLPFYALLDSNISQVEYLDLGKRAITNSKAIISKDELNELKIKNSERLIFLLNSLHNQTELPASGIDSKCRICDYEGLCRKSHWNR